MATRDLGILVKAEGAGKAAADIGKVDRSVRHLGVAGVAVGTALGGIIDRVASRVIDAGFASIRMASDLAETQSKVGVVFGQSGAAVLAFGKTAASNLGLSENAAEAAAGTFGNLFVAMGFAQKPAAEMSINLVKLAGDLASFNNIDPTEALEKLRAGLTGESEPLKTLGVNINETILKQKAFDLGLVTTTKEVLPAAIKAQAAYALIFEQTKTAQGDFARTSQGLANQQRILRAQLQNTGAVIGTALLPKITALAIKFNAFLTANQPAIAKFAETLPGMFDAIARIVGGLPWEAMGNALKIGGMGAKAVLDAFIAMPPWVQTAVLTGWGLNKLTGGVVGNIVSELGKGLIRGVLGMNAGVVNINAGVVNGGLGGPLGGGKGLLTVLLASASIIALGVLLGELLLPFAPKDIHGVPVGGGTRQGILETGTFAGRGGKPKPPPPPPKQQGIAPDERAGQALLDRISRGAPFRLATTGSAAARPVKFEFSPAQMSQQSAQQQAIISTVTNLPAAIAAAIAQIKLTVGATPVNRAQRARRYSGSTNRIQM